MTIYVNSPRPGRKQDLYTKSFLIVIVVALMVQLPVYDLVVTKGGPRFSESTREQHVEVRKSEYTGTAVPMPGGLASFLEEVVGRSVVDKTGLKGAYDFHLQWEPDLSGAARDTFPSIFTALQEQLGLKLQPNKGPVKTLSVDHIERPSEN